MSEARRTLDAHAYVDGGLSAAERASFEAAMLRDPRLRARVDAWRAQNDAMQAAFGPAPRARAPAPRPPAEVAAPPRVRVATPRRAVGTRAALAMATFAAGFVAPLGGQVDPRPALAARVQEALRAVGPGAAPLDFASDDAEAVAVWLAARRPGLAGVKLHTPGWTLAGVRLTPGLTDTAALVVFEDALGERAGLWLERNDARAQWPSYVQTGVDRIVVSGSVDGVDFAAAGPRASGAAALAPKRGPQPPR